MTTLTEDLQYWRAERPDEWKMDEFIRKASAMQDTLKFFIESNQVNYAHKEMAKRALT